MLSLLIFFSFLGGASASGAVTTGDVMRASGELFAGAGGSGEAFAGAGGSSENLTGAGGSGEAFVG